MRKQITLFEDQYQFCKELKSKRLLYAFVEYMFEDIEPSDLKGIEFTIFNSLKKRMENFKKIYDGNCKGGQNSHGGGRPRKASGELEGKNKSKTSQQTSKKQEKNNEVEDNILSNDNISLRTCLFADYYGANKGIDETVCNKLIDAKLKQGITLNDIRKGMVLYNCDCRIRQDYQFVKKFETWIKEFHKMSDEQIEESLVRIIRQHKEKKKRDEKYGKSKPAIALWRELTETFGMEKVNEIYKREDTNQPLLHFT